MRPDGSYQKVKPAEGEALVNGQMGMYELLKNDWTQPEPWKLSAAVQEKQPEPSAKAAKPEPAKTEAAPAAKQAEASHPESAAAPESGDRFDQLEQMVNHKKRTEPQPAPAARPIKPVVVETPAPRSRLKRILDFSSYADNICKTRQSKPSAGSFCVFACINKKQTEGGRQKVRAKRWGRAGHGREQPRRRVIFLAVLAGLLVCVVLPVRAQKKTGKLCFPLDTTQYRVSDGYGWRQDPFTGERTFHKGIDLACAEGTEVLAAEGGAVVQVYRSTSYGTCLRVLHTDGSESLYTHLQYAYVRPGEVVEAGQLLGAAGRSGRATGAHLHFELYRQGTACDPADALGLSS